MMDPVTVTFPIGLKSSDPGIINLDDLIIDSTGATLVPTKRAPLVPYVAPEPEERVVYIKQEILESLRDGRAIIYTGVGVCTALGIVVVYQIIASIVTAVSLAIALISSALPLMIIGMLAYLICRPGKEPEELYLKGCPTRSPGVHKVKLCNGRH